MQIILPDVGTAVFTKEERKSLSVRVFPNGCIVVKVPTEATDEEIQRFIKRKTAWIKKQIAFFADFKLLEDKTYDRGRSLLYLGRQYQLIIEKAPFKNFIHVEKNKIVICSVFPDKKEDVKKAIENWFLERSKAVFKERLKAVMKQFSDFQMPTLKIRRLNKRWGSYLKRHEIILNPDLIQASKPAIDYIITHELCHFYYKNHSKAFYDLLTAKIPNWKALEQKMEKQLLRK